MEIEKKWKENVIDGEKEEKVHETLRGAVENAGRA